MLIQDIKKINNKNKHPLAVKMSSDDTMNKWELICTIEAKSDGLASRKFDLHQNRTIMTDFRGVESLWLKYINSITCKIISDICPRSSCASTADFCFLHQILNTCIYSVSHLSTKKSAVLTWPSRGRFSSSEVSPALISHAKLQITWMQVCFGAVVDNIWSKTNKHKIKTHRLWQVQVTFSICICSFFKTLTRQILCRSMNILLNNEERRTDAC